MIKVEHLTKQFGEKIAVNDISFSLPKGKVVGFLGPNGAGKTTTMRMILGMETPTRGDALIDGKRYDELENPLRTVGAMIGADVYHPARSAKNHLKFLAAAAGIPDTRVSEVLDLTGLTDVADKAVGKFSLGMTGRLGIAAAILGEPEYLILDEPVNGLDPEGVIWVREFCRAYAAAGNTVFLSSHLMSEVEHTVDEAIIIGRGEIITRGSLAEIIRESGEKNLEDAFIKLTHGAVEYKSGGLPSFNAHAKASAKTAKSTKGGRK
jgi:ABC-2 type transport system ATP-binding protein